MASWAARSVIRRCPCGCWWRFGLAGALVRGAATGGGFVYAFGWLQLVLPEAARAAPLVLQALTLLGLNLGFRFAAAARDSHQAFDSLSAGGSFRRHPACLTFRLAVVDQLVLHFWLQRHPTFRWVVGLAWSWGRRLLEFVGLRLGLLGFCSGGSWVWGFFGLGLAHFGASLWLVSDQLGRGLGWHLMLVFPCSIYLCTMFKANKIKCRSEEKH